MIRISPEKANIFQTNGITKDMVGRTIERDRKAGLSDDEIMKRIDDKLASLASSPQSKEDSVSNDIWQMAKGVARGATLGLSDKLSKYGAKGINAVVNAFDPEQRELQSRMIDEAYNEEREKEKAWAKKNPVKSFGSEIVGGVLSPANKIVGSFVGGGAGLTGKIGRGAVAGAGEGMIYSTAQSDKDNIIDMAKDGLQGATTGAVIGGAMPIVGAGLKKGVNLAKRGVKAAKSGIEDFPVVRKLLSKSSDEIGDEVSKMTRGANSIDILGETAREGFDDVSGQIKRTFSKAYDKAGKLSNGERISTNEVENVLNKLENETTNEGRKYLQKVKENLRFAKKVENLDDLIQYLKETPASKINTLKGNNEELRKIASDLVEREVSKGTISSVRDVDKLINGGRVRYIKTLGDTLSLPDAKTNQSVKNQLKEYFVKKFGDEDGKTLYDIAIKKDGILDTKFVNKKNIENYLTNALKMDNVNSSGTPFTSGNKANYATPSLLNDSIANMYINVKPNYQQARSLASQLSSDSVNGVSNLTGGQIGMIKEAIDKDIANSLNKRATVALDRANKLYRTQNSNPNSLSSALKRFTGVNKGVSDASLGAKVFNAATSRNGDIKGLVKVLKRSPNANMVKEELQSLITTPSKFNSMSDAQKRLVYGDKLKEFDKIFNGGILNKTEKSLNRLLDRIGNSSDKLGKSPLLPLIIALERR